MSRELDANVVYGFVLEANTPVEDLPEFYRNVMEQDSNPYYNSPDREFNLQGSINCTLQKRHTVLDTDMPGSGDDSQIVVYVRSLMTTATNEARPLDLLTPTEFEKTHIDDFARIFGKKPRWIVYPTYN